MWFCCILFKDRLHPLTLAFAFSLATHCDVPWKPVFLLWGPCLASLCQIAAPLRHLITSQTGAGWWQCWKYYQLRECVRGWEPRGVISVFVSLHVDQCRVWSYKGQIVQLVAALTLSLPLFLLFLPAFVLLHLSPAVTENPSIAEQVIVMSRIRENMLLFVYCKRCRSMLVEIYYIILYIKTY